MPAHKVNEAQPAPAPTWEQLAKMFTYLHLMWDEIPADQLFRHLAQACQEIAAGK